MPKVYVYISNFCLVLSLHYVNNILGLPGLHIATNLYTFIGYCNSKHVKT